MTCKGPAKSLRARVRSLKAQKRPTSAANLPTIPSALYGLLASFDTKRCERADSAPTLLLERLTLFSGFESSEREAAATSSVWIVGGEVRGMAP